MFRNQDNVPLIRSYLIAVQHASDFQMCWNYLTFASSSSTLKPSMMLTMSCWSRKKITRLYAILLTVSTISTMLASQNVYNHTSYSSSDGWRLIYTRFVSDLYLFGCWLLYTWLHWQKNGKWEESISLSKQDKLFKDAMVTAAASALTEIAEDLLTYFVDIGNKECFGGLLYICFDLLRSDVVEELTWQHALNDFYMPYKLQSQRHLVEKVCYTSQIWALNFP